MSEYLFFKVSDEIPGNLEDSYVVITPCKKVIERTVKEKMSEKSQEMIEGTEFALLIDGKWETQRFFPQRFEKGRQVCVRLLNAKGHTLYGQTTRFSNDEYSVKAGDSGKIVTVRSTK